MARLRPGSGKGEKVRVFVDSAALCEDVPRMRQALLQQHILAQVHPAKGGRVGEDF